jgi:uncharacterized protein (DUF433 family)
LVGGTLTLPGAACFGFLKHAGFEVSAVIEAGKCGGRPCLRGLRIRVSDILELLSAGASFDELLKDYPFLEREDILAALD